MHLSWTPQKYEELFFLHFSYSHVYVRCIRSRNRTPCVLNIQSHVQLNNTKNNGLRIISGDSWSDSTLYIRPFLSAINDRWIMYILYRLNTRSAWWTQSPCNAGHGHIPDIMKVQSAFRLAVIARIVGLFTTILTVEQRINACFDPPTCGLFLTCTKGIYPIISDTHITSYDKQT